MKIKRSGFALEHRLIFSRPAAGLATRGGQLLETMTEALGAKYPVASGDVSMVQSPRLEDWALRFNLFNGLATIRVSADGLTSTYKNLGTPADGEVAIAVESIVMEVLAAHSPALVYSSDKLAGHLVFEVEGGRPERDAYFSRVAIPGRTDRHQHVSFRVVYPSTTPNVEATCEIAPMYADPQKLFITFDVELSKMALQAFNEKVKVGLDLVGEVLTSVGLERTES